MKTLCKGKFKRVAFLAFLEFVFNKAYNVTFYHTSDFMALDDRFYKGVFVAQGQGCKDRVFVNTSYFTRRIICLVTVGLFKNFTPIMVSESYFNELLNSCYETKERESEQI